MKLYILWNFRQSTQDWVPVAYNNNYKNLSKGVNMLSGKEVITEEIIKKPYE